GALTNALRHRAIEMRDNGEDQVCGVFLPILCQHFHCRAVIHANDTLQDGQKLWREARPALSQNQVVTILNAKPSELFQKVEWAQKSLKVHQPHLHRLPLPFKHSLERFGRAAMPASGIEEDDGDLAAHFFTRVGLAANRLWAILSHT